MTPLSHSVLTLNVRGSSYLGLTRSISWLLMPWLLTSPGHQQPWYWLTVLNVCTSIGWIIFSHSYLHVTHDKISVCLAIWLIWWTNIFVIRMINTPGHVLSPGWPLCKRSGLTLIEVSQHAYSSYQASSLPFIFYHVILATWCNWLDFYWCWIKFCLSLSLSLTM